MSLVTRVFTPARPSVALEVTSTRVSALRLGGGSPPSATYAVEPLPAGAVVPSLMTPNVVDQAAVSAAVGRVLAAVGGGRQVALVVPYSVAKVSLVRLEQVPTRLQELDAMLRFQIRKSVLGNEFVEEMVQAAMAHLAPSGALWLVVVSNVRPVFERALSRLGSRPETVARGRQHVVLRAGPVPS